jgi:ATP-dependent Clp protease ATP-binding subunit ClpX
VPFVVADATCLTEAGYVGEDVESIIKSLWIASDRDVERAARGIVVIDEIDKIARKGDGASSTRDVGGEGVQQALLKMIESDKVTIYPDGARTRPQKELIQVDTTHMCSSSSAAPSSASKRSSSAAARQAPSASARMSTRSSRRRLQRPHQRGHPEDFIKYGLIPEFMGRLPVVVPFELLDEEALLRDPLEAARTRWSSSTRSCSSSRRSTSSSPPKPSAPSCKEAMRRKSGARGLRAILEEIMLEIMYELPDLNGVSECVITEGVVSRGERPELVLAKKSA